MILQTSLLCDGFSLCCVCYSIPGKSLLISGGLCLAALTRSETKLPNQEITSSDWFSYLVVSVGSCKVVYPKERSPYPIMKGLVITRKLPNQEITSSDWFSYLVVSVGSCKMVYPKVRRFIQKKGSLSKSKVVYPKERSPYPIIRWFIQK
eukprot:sb/3473544/